MIYLISDTHFWHKNIIDYEDRPFDNVEEMNQILIKNWNNTVSKVDKVYHLGDFSWGNKEIVSEIVHQLNGYITLIKGNHDKKSNKWYNDAGFDDVIDGGMILEEFFLLTHRPMYLNEHMPYINIHGHLHSNTRESKQYINVGVERTNYKPISLQEIKERIE